MLMHNPPHPGQLLKLRMTEDLTVTALADHVGVTRAQLSSIINERSGISALMSLKLSEAFRTSPEFWLDLQKQYDLWQASQIERKPVQAIRTTAEGRLYVRPVEHSRVVIGRTNARKQQHQKAE